MPRRGSARHDRVRLVEQPICRLGRQVDRYPQGLLQAGAIRASGSRCGQRQQQPAT
jgi:hypothetical protein